MAQSLLRQISELMQMGGNAQLVADAAMSSTNLTSVYGVGGAAAITDHGANIYHKGMFKVRFKDVTGFTTANAQIALAVSQTSDFATRQLVAFLNPISPAATVTVPSTYSWVGEFDNDPTPFRYTRLENAGVVVGATAITFDYEVLALP